MKPRLRKKTVRAIFLLHRWLGITLGSMMCVWCLSGFVMLWKAWPQPDEMRAGLAHERVQLDTAGVLPPLEGSYRSFRIVMAGAIPVLQTTRDTGAARSFDLRTGKALSLSPDDLENEAARYAGPGRVSVRFEGLRDHDQWILNTKGHQSGFYRYAFDDPQKSLVYLSPVNGDVVQATTEATRFWSWLGAIPHWLYPSLLKRHQRLWVNTLIILSGAGIILTSLGLWIGWRRLGAGRQISPYRGTHFLHHVTGLIFGLMLLSWITTGFLSMNPAGLFAPGPAPGWVTRLNRAVTSTELEALLETLRAHPESRFRDIRLSAWGDKAFIAVIDDEGKRLTLDPALSPLPLTVEPLKQALGRDGIAASVAVLEHDDSYYFSTRHLKRPFPVFRVTGDDGVRLYLDARCGAQLLVAEAGAKGSRWFIYGPHDLNFFGWLRTPLARLLIRLPLLLGVSAICLTGLCLGIMRLRFRITTTRTKRRKQDRSGTSG
ncbi:PepSY domain-containing protein [Asaia sp. BMEF1]|uniref:PepSY domain-containing protein n=1 Tax=Asaia sp. BMEF1 TaxID=3155932 RepID=UPI003F675CFC